MVVEVNEVNVLSFVLSLLILNVFMCEMRRPKVSNYGHMECIVISDILIIFILYYAVV